MSRISIKEENLTTAHESATMNNYQANHQTENLLLSGDIIDIISESDDVDALPISDNWRGIVEDLCGL